MDSLTSFLKKAMSCYGLTGDVGQQPGGRSTDPSVGITPAVEATARPLSPEMDAAWCEAARIFHDGQVVQGIVTGWNRGGLLVRWNSLQGFVPASQLKEVPLFVTDESRDEKLALWVGEELHLKVIELDRSRNRLVFSERATIWGPKDGDRLLTEIAPGEVRQGHVSNLCDFGAFVDLGGIDGLVHISELSWGRVNHPRELLEIGQQVEVYVISIDRDHRRVALSLKRLRPDPWSVVDHKYHVGQVTSAVITNVVDFGAFARIEEGLEGLVHISELSSSEFAHPSEVVKTGDPVLVRILRIDSANCRLGLSIRQATEEPPTGFEPQESSVETEWGKSAGFLY